MSLMGGGLWGVGFVTVDMRIRKLLKRFLATPMRKSDFLAGVMLSRLLFMVPEVLVLLVFARLAFGVVIYGSLLAVLFLILLGAVTFAGLGLLVASRAKTLGSRLGPDEPGDAADVDALGHLLFVRALSRGGPAVHQAAAADGAEQRAAGRDAGRREPGQSNCRRSACWPRGQS